MSQMHRTADGKIIAIQDMSEDHLVNAIRYLYKREQKYTQHIADLFTVLRQKLFNKFMSQVETCKYCGKTMTMCEFTDIEQWGSSYKLCCNCGSTSNWREFKPIDFEELINGKK